MIRPWCVADLALKWSGGGVDFALVDSDLETDAGLESVVRLCLGTDRRADDTDTVPDGTDDRRGWWADEFAIVEGDRLGSRDWLLTRSTASADVVPRSEEYAREALAWLVEDGVASSIEVSAELEGHLLRRRIEIVRPNGGRWAEVFETTLRGGA